MNLIQLLLVVASWATQVNGAPQAQRLGDDARPQVNGDGGHVQINAAAAAAAVATGLAVHGGLIAMFKQGTVRDRFLCHSITTCLFTIFVKQIYLL